MFQCRYMIDILGMGLDGRYALTGALACGDLRDDCGDFSLGGWRFWDCAEFGISC